MKSEALRFLVVGGLNTGSTYLIYLLLNLVVPYVTAYSVAYICGIVVSYILNARWTFKSDMSWKTFFLFPLVYLVQYGVGVFLLRYLVESLDVSESAAPVIVIVVTLPITFILSRMIIKATDKCIEEIN